MQTRHRDTTFQLGLYYCLPPSDSAAQVACWLNAPGHSPLGPAAQVNSLTSFETELPYEYYTLPFCKPPEGVKKAARATNLGTILQGLRIENSPYNFTTMVTQVRGTEA